MSRSGPFQRVSRAGKHHRHPVRNAPGGALAGNRLRRDGCRIEPVQAETTRHREQARLVDAVNGQDALGGELGVGDDRIAARHHGIVANLPPGPFVHLAVIGGDEARLLRARGCQGAPCRGAAARMYDMYRRIAYEPAEAADILGHDDRVLGLRIHQEHGDARRRQLVRQPSAAGRHIAAPPFRATALATSTHERSAPPASSSGITWRMPGPASGPAP